MPINPQERLFPSQPARFWNALDTQQPFLKHSSLKFRLPNIQASIFQTFQLPFVLIFFLILSLWVLICSLLYGPYFSIYPENVSIFFSSISYIWEGAFMYKLIGKTFLPQRLQNPSMNYRLYLFSNLQIDWFRCLKHNSAYMSYVKFSKFKLKSLSSSKLLLHQSSLSQ